MPLDLSAGDPAGLRRRMTRRRLLRGATALTAAVPLAALLAACGGDDNGGAATTTATEPAGNETGSAATPGTASPTAAANPEASGGEWTFTDDRGITVTLPSRPERIVAQTAAAAALWDYGIRPVGIFGPYRMEDGSPDFQAGNIDLDAVEYLGDYGEMDLEKLVALQADVYVDFALYDDQLWYLGDTEPRVKEIVPTIGISMQGVSILQSIERFEELAGLLGADLSAPEVVEAKEEFAAAEADLKAAIEEKPDLRVLVISNSLDQIYIASPEWMTDLRYFADLGLDIVTHETEDFFESLSWEQANKYPADLILVDQRPGLLTQEQLNAIPTWTSLPAVQAGQVGPWYAGAPYSHHRFAPIMRELAEIIRNSRDDIV